MLFLFFSKMSFGANTGLHLQGYSVKAISEQLNRTRQWVYKWLHKYEQQSAKTWYLNGSCAPKVVPKKTDTSLEKLVTEYPQDFIGVQQMDLIGPRYLKGGFRFYFYTIMDTENHFAGIYPTTDKSAESIVPCLLDF
jgi:hypothetical protein